MREAYWLVRLFETSSKRKTMTTPFGRYVWKRLRFGGLKVCSEIFQRQIDEALGDMKGIFNIVGDIIVVGHGSTDAEAVDDNQLNLPATLE